MRNIIFTDHLLASSSVTIFKSSFTGTTSWFDTFQPTLCIKMHCGHWLKLFCHIKLEAGEQTRKACDRHWKDCLSSHTPNTHTHTHTHSFSQDTQCPFIVFLRIESVCLVYRSSASSSSSSDPEGPWRTSSYHLLVSVFIWIRPCNRSCKLHITQIATSAHFRFCVTASVSVKWCVGYSSNVNYMHFPLQPHSRG